MEEFRAFYANNTAAACTACLPVFQFQALHVIFICLNKVAVLLSGDVLVKRKRGLSDVLSASAPG